MIKFFRNVRQSLLMKNQTIRYFKYAIGEIILVVIGILIALQVNNWNEQRKSIAQAKKNLATIRLNLQDDIKQAEDLLLETKTALNYANTFFDQFKTLAPLDNKVQMYLIYLMFERSIEVNETGLNALLNAEGMSFIDEDLQGKILDYYRFIEQLKRREENANVEIKELFEPYVKSHYYWIYNKTNPWHRQIEYYKDDPRHINDLDLQLASVIADKQLEMMVVGRIYQSKVLIDFYTQAITLANEIISYIENSRDK